MTKTLLGTAVGALALGSLVTAQALKAPSTDAAESRSNASTSPVLVNCGDGYKALIRPVAIAGQQASQVDCVAATPAYPVSLDAYGQPVPYSSAQPVLASYSDAPIARPAVQTRTVYRDRPAAATRTTSVRQPTTQTRSWKKSALDHRRIGRRRRGRGRGHRRRQRRQEGRRHRRRGGDGLRHRHAQQDPVLTALHRGGAENAEIAETSSKGSPRPPRRVFRSPREPISAASAPAGRGAGSQPGRRQLLRAPR